MLLMTPFKTQNNIKQQEAGHIHGKQPRPWFFLSESVLPGFQLRGCVRKRIVRAFLIEEQKCVKQVLAEKLSQAKEKETGNFGSGWAEISPMGLELWELQTSKHRRGFNQRTSAITGSE